MTKPAKIHYRKLPGRRRGFLFGSSVWLGPDHLLLVKSSRFREEYRQFYFRDIQAIVSADAPRFHISTRSALFGSMWLVAILFAYASEPLEWAAGMGGLACVVAWAYVSMWQSCRCRIYTAVSSEDLPSVYRRWTARRFVETVAPHVVAVQGELEAEAVGAIEHKEIGPLPEGRVGLAARGTAAPPPARATRTWLSAAFVAILCIGGVADLAALRMPLGVARWVVFGFVLAQIGLAVAVLVQNFTGKLSVSMRNLAIATAVAIGVWYYGVQTGASVAVAYRNAKEKNLPRTAVSDDPGQALEYGAARWTAGGIGLLAGMAGIVLLARGDRESGPVSFHV